jgi:hypothetical protein
MMDDAILAFWMTCGITVFQSLLILVVLRKAGFGWLLAATGTAPIVGLTLQSSLIFHGHVTPSEGVSLALPFALLPLLILALKAWPLAAKHNTSPETFQ